MGKLLTALKRIEARGCGAREVDAPPAEVAAVPDAPPGLPDWPPLATVDWPQWTDEDTPTAASDYWPATEIDDLPTLVDAETAEETDLLPVADADIVADWAGTPERVEPEANFEAQVELPLAEEIEAESFQPQSIEPMVAAEAPAVFEPIVVAEEAEPDVGVQDSSCSQDIGVQALACVQVDERNTEHQPDVVAAAESIEPNIAEVADELPATLRLPGFGRPPGYDGPDDFALPGSGRSAVVPFLPPSHRPYREACESILAALDTSRRQAVLLAWCDDDLDHSPLCVRLAEGLADRLDDPVLVIDVGQRRRLSALLRVPGETTLSDALSGQVSWRELIVQTGTAGLCALPSAAGDFGTDSVSVARLIDGCKEAFALLLIVGGPVSGLPDSLLAACDAAVLLVEAQHTPQAAAASQIERLRRSGTEVAGCLLTGSP